MFACVCLVVCASLFVCFVVFVGLRLLFVRSILSCLGVWFEVLVFVCFVLFGAVSCLCLFGVVLVLWLLYVACFFMIDCLCLLLC